MAPPPPPRQSYFSCLLVWDACHVVGATCNDCWSLRNTFGWTGTLQTPQQFNRKVVVEVQGARHLEAPKNLHLMVPLLLSNNTWMVMHFFMYIAVQSHGKIPQVQNFQFSRFLSEKKCVCSIVPAQQYF